MTDYAGKAEALEFLKGTMRYHDTVTPDPRTPALSEAAQERYLDGYATICEFLGDRERFKAVLKRVSAAIWSCYCADPSGSNKFTRALGVVASRKGFKVNQNLEARTIDTSTPMKFRLVGGDHEIGFFFREKLFWKDSMHAYHGEHSHSLQWLTIAFANLRTDIAIDDLYKYSNRFWARTTSKEECYMWNWLADCFPENGDDDTKIKHKRETHDLFTKTQRSPQNIMSLILPNQSPIPDHFVSHYLFYRYKKRNWIHDLPNNKVRLRGDAQGYAKRHLKGKIAAGDWVESGRGRSAQEPEKVVRLYRRELANQKQREELKCKEYTFHGKTGNLYMDNLPD